jgi:hypothetical protein
LLARLAAADAGVIGLFALLFMFTTPLFLFVVVVVLFAF